MENNPLNPVCNSGPLLRRNQPRHAYHAYTSALVTKRRARCSGAKEGVTLS